MTAATFDLARPEGEGEGEFVDRRFEARMRYLVVVILGAAALGFVLGMGLAVLALSLAGLALLVIGLDDPRLMVVGLLVLCALDAFTKAGIVAGGLWSFNTLNLIFIGVLAINAPILLRRREPHTATWLLLIVVLVVMLEGSADRQEGIEQVIYALSPLALVAAFARAGADRETWVRGAAVVGLMGAVLGPLYFLNEASLDPVNKNVLAYTFLAPPCALVAAVGAFRLTRRERTLYLALAAANVMWIFLTASRGGLALGLLCLGFIGLVGADATQKATIVVTAVIGLGLLLTQVTEVRSQTLERIDKLFDSEKTLEDRTSGRSELLTGGWNLFVDHPEGIGTGAFRATLYASDYHVREEKDAHAGWMKVLVENGVVGAVVLAGYVASFAVAGLKSDRLGRRLGLFTTLFLAFALIHTEFGAKGLWVLPAAATVLIHDRAPPTRAVTA